MSHFDSRCFDFQLSTVDATHEYQCPLCCAGSGREMSPQLDPHHSPEATHLQELPGSFHHFSRRRRLSAGPVLHRPLHPQRRLRVAPGFEGDQISHLFAGSNPGTSLQCSALADRGLGWLGSPPHTHSKGEGLLGQAAVPCLPTCDSSPLVPGHCLRLPVVRLHPRHGERVSPPDPPVLGGTNFTDSVHRCVSPPDSWVLCAWFLAQDKIIKKRITKRPNRQPKWNSLQKTRCPPSDAYISYHMDPVSVTSCRAPAITCGNSSIPEHERCMDLLPQ